MKKIFRRALTALLIVAGLLMATLVGAAVQIFDGKGEWHTNDDDNQQIAMSRAQQRAERDAQKRAGVYLKTFSRTVNLELADDVISAVTNNIIEIVGDVHFDKKIIPLSESQTTILYVATLKAKIDPEGIYDFVKRDEKDKVTIVHQNNELRDAIQKNDELAASLIEQYNRATIQAEKDKLRAQLNDADRYFLANQKFKEGLKLYYVGNYNGAIKCYDEAVELNPVFVEAYNNRGVIYSDLNDSRLAIQDYNQAIQLDPNYANAYLNRGNAYKNLNLYESAIQDYNRSIQLNPNTSDPYLNRGNAYKDLGQPEAAIRDYTKAIQLNPKDSEAYSNRGAIYMDALHQFAQAIQDFNKAIQLNPNSDKIYYNRGTAYAMSGEFRQAISDFTSAIQINPNHFNSYHNRGLAYANLKRYEQAIQDFNNYIRLVPNSPDGYRLRGLCYQKLGNESKAQADFAKAKQLGAG